MKEFRTLIRDLSVGMTQPKNGLREKYLERRTTLEDKRSRSGRLPVEGQISLSAYLIRLKQYDAAVDLLTPLAAQERGNFMVYANLITAHQLGGQLDRARAYLSQIQGGRPQGWPGLTAQQLDWFARVERYHQDLIKLRFREALAQVNPNQQTGRPKLPATIDDLFGVRLIGPSGRYEAGRLADDQKAKLPPDAVAIVQQLLVWLPDDTRLYWLLGELLNAQGDLEGATQVFDECSWLRRFDTPELQQHRQIVQEALAQAAPGAPDLGPESPAPSSPEEPSGWLPDRGHLVVVGIVAGLLLAGLGYLQLRELRHRRQGKPSISKSG
jgi:tetratricopeptide (TPR) repeat protein